ncbi:MAG: DUF4139 domain-containing protein [Gammaproteobacteria bacterium]|nr:DUF4139 domain-containing protein [Gammaproteobacteria bacterium]
MILFPIRTNLQFFICILTLTIVMNTDCTAKEQRTTLEDQTAVAVTIYNEDLALIKDQRLVTLEEGISRLAYRGVSANMRPETAMLRSINAESAFHVLEQNFDYDLLTPDKLLDHYVGKSIKIIRTNPATGKETVDKATVLSTHQGVVVQIGDRLESNPRGQFVFDHVPSTLRDEPTLVTQIQNKSAGQHKLELSYLSGGLSWQADYVAELSADDQQLDLLGWVTLKNHSGAYYKQARLQLVAGDVNRVKQDMQLRTLQKGRTALAMESADSMSEESLFEYHLYSLNRPTDIANNQTKQVSLLAAQSVPVDKEYVLQGQDYYYRSSYGNIGEKLKVGVYVQFENREAHSLGMPMPKGIIRVYKRDSGGHAQFIGEDRIDHTPNKDTIRLKLGDAFDVTANRNQTRFARRSASEPFNHVFEAAYEIELKNAKQEAVNVVVREPIPGDWKMLKESHQHKKVASGTSQWTIKIDSESSTVLKYTVLVRY